MEMMYNNFMLTNMINITDVRRPVIGVRNVNALEINGRHGQLFQNAYFGTKVIEVDFYIKYDYSPNLNDASVFQKVVKSLAYYLTSNTAPAKLIFSDDPNNYYLALVTDITIEQLLKLGQGTITFECYSPFMYSLAEYTANESNGLITIDNDGTASTYPIFETTLSTNATYLTLVGKNGVVQVGNPDGILLGTSPTNPTLTYSNTCIDTTQWYKGAQNLLWNDRLVSDNVSLIAGRYSLMLNQQPDGEENSKKYHGGFYMHNLPRAVEYWQCKLYFSLACDSPEQMGMVELFLFDENNTVITNLSMRDFYPNMKHNVPMWFSGKRDLLWKEDSGTGSVTTQTYVQEFESLDDVPKGATIIADVEIAKYKATINFNGTDIWSYPDTSRGKVLTRGAKGNTYPVKETNASWTSVYMNSAKTTVGYIRTSGVTISQDGTAISVTYKMPVDSASNGNWNNYYGCVIFDKTPHPSGTGHTWSMGLYNKNNNNSWAGKVIHQTNQVFQDQTGTSMTSGSGKLARIGFFLGSYQDAPIPTVCQFDDIVVTEYVDENSFDTENGESGFTYIGNVGDTITIDMGEQMVYKNNEPFMEYVDVGSEFFEIDAFSSSEVRVISDDENANTTAYFRKRYI